MTRIIGGIEVTCAMIGNNVNKKKEKSPARRTTKGEEKSPARRTTKGEEKGRCKLDFSNEKKPLKSKKVFLDVQNTAKVAEMTKQIEMLGGKVEDFLSKEISLVVTTQKCVDKIESLKSGQSPSPYSTGSPLQQQHSNRYSATQVHSPFSMDSPHHSGEGVKKRLPSNVSRGKEVMLRAMSSKKGSGTPDVAGKAKKLGARLLSVEEFMDTYVRRGSVKEVDITSLKSKRKQPAMMRSMRHHSVSHVQAMKLMEPFFKVEIKSRQYRPIVHEIKKWPKIYSKSVSNDCPFDVPNEGKSKKRMQDAEMEQDYLSVAEKSGENVSVKEKMKDDKTKDVKVGDARKVSYCDCCCVRYTELKKHIKSEKHRTFARNNDNYKDLDTLIALCTPFEELLQHVKSNVAKQDLNEVETTNMEPSINPNNDVLERKINQLCSSLHDDKTIKVCNKVIVQAIDFLAIEQDIENKDEGNYKESNLIEENETNKQENDLENAIFNDGSHLENHELDIDDNQGIQVKTVTEKNVPDVDMLDWDDNSLKELDEIDKKVECLNIGTHEGSSNEREDDVKSPSINKKSTISCETVNMHARNEKQVKPVVQDNSIAETSTEPYEILGCTISDNEQSILQEDIVETDVMYQLKHTEKPVEENHHINVKKATEDKERSCVTGNTCTLEVKTIFEVSSIEATSSFMETLKTVSKNKDIPSKKEDEIKHGIKKDGEIKHGIKNEDEIKHGIHSIVCTDNRIVCTNNTNTVCTNNTNTNTTENLSKEDEKRAPTMDANNTSEKNVNIDPTLSNDSNDVNRNTDKVVHIPQDLKEPVSEEVILLPTGQISASDHVDNLPSESERNIEGNEDNEVPVSNTDGGTGGTKLHLCGGLSSTPYKHISERENEMDFSLQSSLEVDPFEGDEEGDPLLSTINKDFLCASKFKMGCKENLSPICRRTKRKNRKKVLSCTNELDNVLSCTNELDNVLSCANELDNVESELNISAEEEYLKILREESKGMENAKKELISVNYANTDNIQHHKANLNKASMNIISNLIENIGSTPKQERRTEDLNSDILLKHMLEFKSPGRILETGQNLEMKKDSTRHISEVEGSQSVVDLTCKNISSGVMKKKKLDFGEDEVKSSNGRRERDKNKNENKLVEELTFRDKCKENNYTHNNDTKKPTKCNVDYEGSKLTMSLPDSNTSDDLGDSDDSEDIILSRLKRSSKAGILNVDDVYTPESQKGKKCVKTRSKSDISDHSYNSDNSNNSENLSLAKVKELSREGEDFLDDDVFTPESKTFNKVEKSKCERTETDRESDTVEYDPLNTSYRTFIKLYGRRSCKRSNQKRKYVSPVENKRERKKSRNNNEGVSNRTLRNRVSSCSKKTSSTTKVKNELKSKSLKEISSSISSSMKPIMSSPRLSEHLVSSKCSTLDSIQKKRSYSERNGIETDKNIESSRRTISQDSCISANRDTLNSSPDAIKKKQYLDLKPKAPHGLESSIITFEFDELDEPECSSQPSSSNLFKSPTRSKRTVPTTESSNRHGSFPQKDTSYSSKKKCKSRSKSLGKVLAGQNIKFSCGKAAKKNSPYTTNAVFCKRNSPCLSSFDFTGT